LLSQISAADAVGAAIKAAVPPGGRRGAGRTRRKTSIYIFNLNFVHKEIENKNAWGVKNMGTLVLLGCII